MISIIFFGCTKFSEAVLQSVLSLKNVEVKAVISIPESFTISYSEAKVKNTNYADLSRYTLDSDIQFFEFDSTKGQRLEDLVPRLALLQPDVILVMGWYYMVPKTIRNLARLGAWGIHASLLPKYAGGAPLVWAIIEGEKETGVTLFKLGEGVDDGDIIAQRRIAIEQSDTIKDVYHKATVSSCLLIENALCNSEEIEFTAQNKDEIEIWPQRSPKDGEIDWSWSAERIRNFIRAQTRPYPGAWTMINGKKVVFWDADIFELTE